jgi:hypothetical protein
MRAAPRAHRPPRHDGPIAGAQYTAVRLDEDAARFTPQPVPPIFQPEVGAEAIMWATDHDGGNCRRGRRRWRQSSATRSLRGWATGTWARTGYAAQQTDEPLDPQRPDNLWGPARRGPRRSRDVRRPISSPNSATIADDATPRARRCRCGVGAVLAAVTSRAGRRAPYSRCG